MSAPQTAQHTPTPWYVLEVMGKSFIAAKPAPDHPYFNKTRHMDIAGDEEYPRKAADLAFIALTANGHDALVEALTLIEEALSSGGNINKRSSPMGSHKTYLSTVRKALAIARGEGQ